MYSSRVIILLWYYCSPILQNKTCGRSDDYSSTAMIVLSQRAKKSELPQPYQLSLALYLEYHTTNVFSVHQHNTSSSSSYLSGLSPVVVQRQRRLASVLARRRRREGSRIGRSPRRNAPCRHSHWGNGSRLVRASKNLRADYAHLSSFVRSFGHLFACWCVSAKTQTFFHFFF